MIGSTKSKARNFKQYQNNNSQNSKPFWKFVFGNLYLFRISDLEIRISHRRGSLLISLMVFGSIAVVIMGGLAQWAIFQTRLSRQRSFREKAFEIGEAGIEYYRWHLAHAPTDYQDGTGAAGPYVHPYYDKNGTQIGTFTLSITPPVVGSTVVTIESMGVVSAYPNLERIVRAKYGKPSLAKYAVAANADMRFGSGTEVWGPIHSNGGIRFDALAHNLVSSSRSNYNDPDHSGANEFGVHTHISPTDPLPPASIPVRTDVFIAGRLFPVPAYDFTGLTADLASMKTTAQGDGAYHSASGSLGYHVTLASNDTYMLKRITSLRASPSGSCYNQLAQSGWGTWSILNEVTIGTYSVPSQGVIFLEDHVWVDGAIQTARVTIASGRFPDNPSTRTSITVNNDVTYAAYDGSVTLGLIAQNNVNVGLYSEDDLRIDAALVAQYGRIGRYYYNSWCGSNFIRSTLTSWGMLATNQRYGFAYTDGTGYQTRNLNYDTNLLYAPPPSFPLTSDQYSIVSWEEVQ